MLASALCGPGQDKVQTGQLQGKGIKKKKTRGDGVKHENISIYGSLTVFQCYVLWIFAHRWARALF